MADLARLIKAAEGGIDEGELDPYQRAYLRAFTLRDPDAFRALARVVIATLPTGVHSFRGIEKLVRIHFGHGISFVSVRTDLRCRNEQVKEYQQAVRESMAEIRGRLSDSLVVQLGEEERAA